MQLCGPLTDISLKSPHRMALSPNAAKAESRASPDREKPTRGQEEDDCRLVPDLLSSPHSDEQ